MKYIGKNWNDLIRQVQNKNFMNITNSMFLFHIFCGQNIKFGSVHYWTLLEEYICTYIHTYIETDFKCFWISGKFLEFTHFNLMNYLWKIYLYTFFYILQGGPYVSERFCESIFRSLGWLKKKNFDSSKEFMQIPFKVNKVYFFEIKHGLTMTFWKKK